MSQENIFQVTVQTLNWWDHIFKSYPNASPKLQVSSQRKTRYLFINQRWGALKGNRHKLYTWGWEPPALWPRPPRVTNFANLCFLLLSPFMSPVNLLPHRDIWNVINRKKHKNAFSQSKTKRDWAGVSVWLSACKSTHLYTGKGWKGERRKTMKIRQGRLKVIQVRGCTGKQKVSEVRVWLSGPHGL